MKLKYILMGTLSINAFCANETPDTTPVGHIIHTIYTPTEKRIYMLDTPILRVIQMSPLKDLELISATLNTPVRKDKTPTISTTYTAYSTTR